MNPILGLSSYLSAVHLAVHQPGQASVSQDPQVTTKTASQTTDSTLSRVTQERAGAA